MTATEKKIRFIFAFVPWSVALVILTYAISVDLKQQNLILRLKQESRYSEERLDERTLFMQGLEAHAASATKDRITRDEVIAALKDLCRENELRWSDKQNLEDRVFVPDCPFPKAPTK